MECSTPIPTSKLRIPIQLHVCIVGGVKWGLVEVVVYPPCIFHFTTGGGSLKNCKMSSPNGSASGLYKYAMTMSEFLPVSQVSAQQEFLPVHPKRSGVAPLRQSQQFEGRASEAIGEVRRLVPAVVDVPVGHLCMCGAGVFTGGMSPGSQMLPTGNCPASRWATQTHDRV
jgi:hypothetical protein